MGQERMHRLDSAVFHAIAHRGGARENPENSLRAFKHAISLGVTHLETDVRSTRDGVAVIHHDATLDRTTDQRGAVNDQDWSQVARARIHGRYPILRVEELFAALPDAHITLDAKDTGAVAPLLAAIRELPDSKRITVTSFSHGRLQRMRQALPITTAASPREVAKVWRSVRSERQVRIDGQSLAVPVRVARRTLLDAAFIQHAHTLGLPVYAWTINTRQEMIRLIEMGVDGIMTDAPTLLQEVLQDKGL